MESETQGVRNVDFEVRYASAGSISVAWRSETGPRERNQDSARCRLRADGSWLVAVADGLGGHPRGRAAARRAIGALPRRVSGPDELFEAFESAHRVVTKLTPGHLRRTMREIRRCPATTLSVAAWTPESGLVVGMAGDTRVVVLWRDDAGWHGRAVGDLHRSAGEYGYLIRYLGAPRRWPQMGDTDRDPMDIFTDADIETPADLTAFAVLVASDGVWEPIASDAKRPIADAFAAVLDVDDTDAHCIADRVMDTARAIGLSDNATVALGCVTGSTTDVDTV